MGEEIAKRGEAVVYTATWIPTPVTAKLIRERYYVHPGKIQDPAVSDIPSNGTD